jgi:hypothetical protein
MCCQLLLLVLVFAALLLVLAQKSGMAEGTVGTIATVVGGLVGE